MSFPKLYLILTKADVVEKISVHRELDSTQKEWDNLESDDKIGIIHCGFVRPRITGKLEFPNIANGKIVYSSSMKWALPHSFNRSHKSITDITINDELTPCYLALNQWGYQITDENELSDDINLQDLSIHSNAQHKDTISLAAQQVLNDANKCPLNKEEIYARIIESNYYQFNTLKPVHVLDVTLNRETLDTEYSKAAKIPIFGKTKEGRYYLLIDKVDMPVGWVCDLLNENSEMYERLKEFGVTDEETYLAIKDKLPDEFSYSLEKFRFNYLKNTINLSDHKEILKISPRWLLASHVQDIGFTVRIEHILLEHGITKMRELSEVSTIKLLSFPKMGKNSIKDLCEAIITKISNVNFDANMTPASFITPEDFNNQSLAENDSLYLASEISKIPLKQHLERTLEDLSEIDRVVLHDRLGYKGKVLTLEEVGEKLDVTRERIRQRQKKYVDKIIAKEYWDDVIGLRIGQLLLDREEPLILEMLEIEDPWFKGFMGSYVYLSKVIQLFSENAIQVIVAQGRNVITRISQKDWDDLDKDIKNNLRQKAKEKKWTRTDINLLLESTLAQFSAEELVPLLEDVLLDYLQFDGEDETALLVAYGRNAESAIKAVLAQAEKPLHYTEISRRATVLLGKPVEERRAHNAAAVSKGIWLYDRGVYGLIDHCPIPESKRKSILLIVEVLLYQGEINKQWHSKEIIENLKSNFSAIPDELDPYVLRMCLEKSEKITFLNRMVWARSDSGLSGEDRVDLAEAFIQILEENGKPLSGKELKNRLSEVRGVDKNMQIQPNGRLITVGPNIWGLSEW